MQQNYMSLMLGLVMFAFMITSISIVPFINFLYKLRFTRRKEAPKTGKIPLFDKLHDKKSGTPVGGGVLIVGIVSFIFLTSFFISQKMGIYIQSAYNLRYELSTVFFTFLSFALLGFADDYKKNLGVPSKGRLGLWFGLRRKQKFVIQWILALTVGVLLYNFLGISIVHIPIIGVVIDLGIFFIPFSAFVIVAFANAFNITDGLDGLATGLLLICLFAFGIIAAGNLDTPLTIFIAVWSGALIAFLYFNIWPARIWLGDTGAMSFGATLGVIGLLTGNIAALLVICGLFVIEVASSAIQIIGWKILKKPILPLAPIHNTFLVNGWEEPKIVMRAWLTGIVFAIFGLWLATI